MCGEGNCCRSFAKVLLIIINLIFFLAGLLMLAFGIAVTAAPKKVINILSNLGENDFDSIKDASDGYFADIVRAVGIFMIVLGAIVGIIGMFGFFGACCESKCMLITYIVLLIIIILAEVALIIFGAVFPSKFEDKGKELFYKYLSTKFHQDFVMNSTGSYLTSNDGKDEAIWNTVQWELNCCGVYGLDDYKKFNWTKCQNCLSDPSQQSQIKVPLSCCKRKDTSKIPTNKNEYDNVDDCLVNAKEPSTNTKSCAEAAKDTIIKYGKIAIGIAAGIAGLELILITLAFIMCCMWEERTGKYV